jgi:hypothetical protein
VATAEKPKCNQTQSKPIGRRGDLASVVGLLGGHVPGGSQNAALGSFGTVSRGGRLRDAKIQDLHNGGMIFPFGQKKILWLQVPVDHCLPVGSIQTSSDLSQPIHDL